MSTARASVLFLVLSLALTQACTGGLGAPDADTGTGTLDAGAPTAAELQVQRRAAARARAVEARLAEREQRARARALEAARPQAEAAAGERAERAERARVEADRIAFETRWPMGGVAFHFLTRVYAEPNANATVIGYMRRGARFRAGQRAAGVGCARGFFPVPGGGFVCRGEGTMIGADPQSFEPSPVPPAIDDALPYAYVWVAHDHEPEFWRLPTVAEEAEARAAIARSLARAANAATAAPAAPTPESQPDDAAGDDGVEAPPPPGTDDDSDDADRLVAEEGTVATVTAAPIRRAPDAGVATDGGVPAMPSILRRVLRRGFYVSVDHEERDGNRRFLRTIRGGYVSADAVTPNDPPDHRGVVLGGAWQLPVAFVYRDGTHRLLRDPSSGRLSDDGLVARLTPFPVAQEIRRGNHPYAVSSDGFLVRSSSLRIARVHARPAGVGPQERWIHVDLDTQTLVAYVGDEPNFATVVSSGREGHDTPTGLFHIQSKHLSTTMDDLGRGEESYLIEDVPWTMYFEGNFALHAAFWHSAFGHVKSHGCVNLAPADARYLFQWSLPTLPDSWHGVFARVGEPGTAVWITRAAPPASTPANAAP